MNVYWSNARYAVWSTHKDGLESPTYDVLEVRRTDPRVAAEDAKLISSTFKRPAWVVDTGDLHSKRETSIKASKHP
jgi:hypothetical protein